MRHAYICDYTRTPIGRYAGILRDIRTDDLAAHPLRVMRERHAALDWECIDDVILGCANQAGEDNRNIARMALLLQGFQKAYRAPQSTGYAVPAWMLWAWRPTVLLPEMQIWFWQAGWRA